MPVQYAGVLPEHKAVRTRAGVFDVSHMGIIAVEGTRAERLLDFLSTNHILGKPAGSSVYTVWCHPEGGSVDDLIIFKRNPQHFYVVANAANRQKDLHHLQSYAQDVVVRPCWEEWGILAVQGPDALEKVARLIPEARQVRPHHFVEVESLLISGTGYTGAGGVELFVPVGQIGELWDSLLQEGVEPAGLGARDLLRLEMGYALYGHELSDKISPLESVSSWTVKWDKEFLGKEALLKKEQQGGLRTQQGIVLDERGVAREGQPVYKEGQKIGYVTSGNFSPTLQRGIALVSFQEKLPEGTRVEVEVRQNFLAGHVTKIPWIGEGR